MTRDIVDRLRELATTRYHGLDKIRIAARDAAEEIKRLRATLESLTHDPPATLAREPGTDCEVVLKMRAIARAALEPKP